ARHPESGKCPKRFWLPRDRLPSVLRHIRTCNPSTTSTLPLLSNRLASEGHKVRCRRRRRNSLPPPSRASMSGLHTRPTDCLLKELRVLRRCRLKCLLSGRSTTQARRVQSESELGAGVLEEA